MGPECPCPKAVRPLGRLYGISMGEGRVRLSTDPYCRIHNEHRCAGDAETCAYCGLPRIAWIHPETRR